MKPYSDLIQKILDKGEPSLDRTGTGTISLFGEQMRFNLRETFPLLTLKKTSFKNIAVELLWMIDGCHDMEYLALHGCTIWDEWKNEEGNLGPIYGAQWRAWEVDNGSRPPIDQLQDVIDRIKANPYDRRLIVSAWNVGALNRMMLPPCHMMFQFYVRNGELSCQMYQRSCDMFLGVPYNIASYALLTHMVAHITGLKVGDFIWCGGDVHLYNNHIEQAKEMLTRDHLPLPTLSILTDPSLRFIDDFDLTDFELKGYNAHAAIRAPISV